MNKSVRTLRWVWRAWPVIGVLPLFVCHLALLGLTPYQAHNINSTVAVAVKIIGGLLVLFSIDSNIGVIRGGSLFSEFKKYLGEFPFIKKSAIVDLQAGSLSLASSKARVSLERNPKTVEERLDYLQEQIDEARRDLGEDISKLDTKFRQRNADVDNRMMRLDRQVGQLDSKVEDALVGGIKIQLFGVMLLVYGSITSYLSLNEALQLAVQSAVALWVPSAAFGRSGSN